MHNEKEYHLALHEDKIVVAIGHNRLDIVMYRCASIVSQIRNDVTI